jgi:Ras-related protein Rab-1A
MSEEDDDKKYDYIFKLILIGSSGVGKTSILQRYIQKIFNDDYTCTIGVDFFMKSMKIDDKLIKLQLWDTAGTEKFKSITTGYYRGANAAFIVFDLTSRKSFESVSEWIENYYKYSNPDYERHVILIGNKSDLKNERIITEDEIDDFVKLNKIKYFETSAKNGENIDECFLFIAEKLMKDADEKGILYNEKSGNINAQNLKNNAVDINGGNRCCF